MSLTPGERLGPYEILSAIGAGGMGEVYRARDTKLNRDVAIKILLPSVAGDPDRLARFSREAQVLASLNHPNIAHIYGIEDNGLVMELVQGEDLSAIIARGPISPSTALPIARQIAGALEAAHEQGIIHRDLKPANVKVREDGTVKVLDFGLAKALDPASSSAPSSDAMNSPTITSPAMTAMGMILGTAAYMAPEQAKGKHVDKRADIWAFGVVLYEMLTGRRLFEAEDVSETLAAVLTRDVSAPVLAADLPLRLRALLRDCLVRDPTQRLRDIGDARLVLDRIIAGAADDVVAPAVPPTTAQSALRRLLPWAMAGVFAAGLIGALAVWAPWRAAPVPPLVRIDADLGPDAVAGLRSRVAISRDGRRIVYPIPGANGTSQLATRLLDQETATPLPGTQNGESPFFSPDGRWIAFLADGKLKKVPVFGGDAVALCDAPLVRGGSWGDDRTIIVSPNLRSGLVRVPDTGGTSQPLTTLVNGEVTHRYPQILPGGQAVLFTASKSGVQFEDAAIEVLSLKTGQVTTVVQGGYFGRYLAGHLLYMHEGVLFSVPFDLPRLEVRGTPVPLLGDVASYQPSGAGQFDFSETGTFVYRSGSATSTPFPIVWMDSVGKTQPLLAKPGHYATPRVSPDGRRLALTVEDGKSQDIYTYDIQRDTLSRLTFDGRGNVWPVWTPDGKHIVYASATDNTIWWIRADGAGERQRLLVGKNLPGPWSFSPDGRYLSYDEVGAETKSDIWLLPVDATDPEHPKPGTPEVFLKTPAIEAEGVFSPDGRWMSYSSDESGKYQVSVRPFHSAVGGKWQISTTDGTYSYWSRDGRSLYYVTVDRRIMVVDYTATGESFAAGTPRVWSPAQVRAASGGPSADLAPDGKRFAVLPVPGADESSSFRITFLLNFLDYMGTVAAGKK